MPRSETTEANAIVAAVTHLVDLVQDADEEGVLALRIADGAADIEPETLRDAPALDYDPGAP